MNKYRESDKWELNMARYRKSYQRPEVRQVSLVPDEAVLTVCKDHNVLTQIAPNMTACSHPTLGEGGDSGLNSVVCRGVTGS